MMKRIFKRLREKLYKDLPPPYREDEGEEVCYYQIGVQNVEELNDVPTSEVIDLLASCNISNSDAIEKTEVEYAEIQDMGIWHSTPLTQRHKSKISLTWVLKDNLENCKPNVETLRFEDKPRSKSGCEMNRCHRHKKLIESDRKYRTTPRDLKDRVVGRNEHYHELRFRSACEFTSAHTCSDDTSVFTEEQTRRRHRHKHRRKKKRQSGKFGYDIRDLDSFLSDASIDRPGNIPVVIAYPTTLYQTQRDLQREVTLPLGTVVNAVFKNQQWLYVQTPHAQEGYVLYNTCLPLGILPNRTSTKTPCWESSTDIYPRPCGNLTDTEKERMRPRTRSESRYQLREKRRNKTNSCAEKEFDTLYLKTKSVCSNLDKVSIKESRTKEKRQTLLVINSDFKGNLIKKTLTVQQGDVVVLIRAGRGEEANSDWFYVKKRDGTQGFIPANIAGFGYI